MSRITVEAHPDAERLASPGVNHWLEWKKGGSEFPWEYIEDEINCILEGRAVVTPEGVRRRKSARAIW